MTQILERGLDVRGSGPGPGSDRTTAALRKVSIDTNAEQMGAARTV